MEIYLLLIVIVLLFTITDLVKYKQKKEVMLLNLLLIYYVLTLFAGLRYNVGPDYDSYTDIYNNIVPIWNIISGKADFNGIHGEYGYLLLNSILKTFCSDSFIVFLCMSAIGMGMIAYSCLLEINLLLNCLNFKIETCL